MYCVSGVCIPFSRIIILSRQVLDDKNEYYHFNRTVLCCFVHCSCTQSVDIILTTTLPKCQLSTDWYHLFEICICTRCFVRLAVITFRV